MKFLCDEMLGSLAKWLRILGYDTKYIKNINDKKIIEIAEKEGRIVITRDKLLAKKSKGIYINEKDIEKQLKKVVKCLNLNIEKEKILTRCTICNIKVVRIEKEKVKGKVPEYVWNNNENFWICPTCNRIYWIGSHWNKMEETIKKLQVNTNH